MAKSASKSKSGDRPSPPPSFEKSLARLEEIVERLDDGNLPLEQSLAFFKEGTKLARICRSLLADAEVQVKEALREVEAENGGDDDEDDTENGDDDGEDDGDEDDDDDNDDNDDDDEEMSVE